MDVVSVTVMLDADGVPELVMGDDRQELKIP
jgi:hypothetical protein